MSLVILLAASQARATQVDLTQGMSGANAADGRGRVHFDVQRFDLSGLLGQNLASISFTGDNPGGGQPFLAAVTTADAVAPVPEPATWAMTIGGVGLVGGAMRRRAGRPALA